MTRWTKPEAYTDKGIAWQAAKEWARGLTLTRTFPSSFSMGRLSFDIEPGSFQPPRIRAEWGGRRSGKTDRARRMGFDLAKGRDKSATWNGRKWILD